MRPPTPTSGFLIEQRVVGAANEWSVLVPLVYLSREPAERELALMREREEILMVPEAYRVREMQLVSHAVIIAGERRAVVRIDGTEWDSIEYGSRSAPMFEAFVHYYKTMMPGIEILAEVPIPLGDAR